MVKYIENAVPAIAHTWKLVGKEAEWLKRSRGRLFQQSIDADWVESLEINDSLSEQVEAFSARYGRLQDTLGNKLFPRLLELVGQSGSSFIDVLNQVERLGILQDAQEWLEWRNLRNKLVHEYMENPLEFASALNTANDYAGNLIKVVAVISKWLNSLGLDDFNQVT